MRRLATLLPVWIAACSALGEPGGRPEGLPHGGTGKFRFLDQTETDVQSGWALMQTTAAVEAGSIAGEQLFYATAPALTPAPMPPADLPDGDIFWAGFEARRIHRGTRIAGSQGFELGPEVLRAADAWEGADVFDPWAVVLPDGRARLYYAAAGGIGVAEAPSIDGDFTRAASAPIVAGTVRRPSVVRGADDRWWMYYDGGDGIHAAVSSDGLSFSPASSGPIDFVAECPPIIDGGINAPCDVLESPEVGVGMPGAVRVVTSGRVRVRLYFESRREDGSRAIFVAGTDDGVAFSRYRISVLDASDHRMPFPVSLDARITQLLTSARAGGRGLETRALSLSVSPASIRFAPLPEPAP